MRSAALRPGRCRIAWFADHHLRRFPRAAVKTVLPVLSQAIGDVAPVLIAHRDLRARALVRTLHTIQRRTVATLTRKARTGKPVTPKVAARQSGCERSDNQDENREGLRRRRA